MKKFVFTCGDVNGIGPEVVIKSLNRITKKNNYKFIFICPENVFRHYSSVCKPEFDYKIIKASENSENSSGVSILDIGKCKINFGLPTKDSGKIAFEAIKLAFELTKSNIAQAMVTAPISKSAFNMAGIKFPGHTELLASWCKVKEYSMFFYSAKMISALITIHTPLKKVSNLITIDKLKSKINLIYNTLKTDFGIENPRLAILGLNPHAGENGLLGKEEKEVIEPFIKKYKLKMNLFGPFPSDAYFGNEIFKQFDITIGMYHDQVLIPFKLLNFSAGVNYTAGLPIVRTSPDHGTAFDKVNLNIANPSSTIEAFRLAELIVTKRDMK